MTEHQNTTLRFRNGDRMPALGLGTWKSSPGQVYAAVKTAVELGYRHIDCAAIYGNEVEVGRALSECFEAGMVARDEMWITSKLWNNAHAVEDVLPAAKKTLKDLHLDYFDLYLMHWPIALKRGVFFPGSADDILAPDKLPVSTTWRAMEELVDQGLCRHVGVSNFSATKLNALLECSRHRPEMNQIELHPYLQQPAMLEFCRKNGVYLTAYSPLGSSDRPQGLKTKNEPVLLEDPTIGAIAERHGVSPAQVLISWAIHRGTSVIPKSVRSERLKQNLAAVSVPLTEEDMGQIAALDRNHRYVDGTFWTFPGSPYTLENLWDE